MSAPTQAPFSARAVLGLVLFGALVFVALLWMVGAGMNTGSDNNGGGHIGGKGLNGYAALGQLLEKRGYTVRKSRSEAALDDPGLLVLTPPVSADGSKLREIVDKRRYIGPTLILMPKWMVAGAGQQSPGAKKGWVQLIAAERPLWQGFLDEVSVDVSPLTGGGRWAGIDVSGTLPAPDRVLSGKGEILVPLVAGRADGRTLAAFLGDEGIYPALDDLALDGLEGRGSEKARQPVVIVFEPDLLNNYGMARRENAELARQLFTALARTGGAQVQFDLTLNGLGRSSNLLTLAFTPPFLAATLCLLLAATVVGWRAFLRFGPARQAGREIAFGKQALVSNTAGLIRRSGRLHLVAGPYADHVRERLVRSLSLARTADPALAEQAIDRAVHARLPGSPPFSVLSARLRAARRPDEIVKAAQNLHSLERKLKP